MTATIKFFKIERVLSLSQEAPPPGLSMTYTRRRDAENEARRLARRYVGDRFAVLAAICCFYAEATVHAEACPPLNSDALVSSLSALDSIGFVGRVEANNLNLNLRDEPCAQACHGQATLKTNT